MAYEIIPEITHACSKKAGLSSIFQAGDVSYLYTQLGAPGWVCEGTWTESLARES